MGLGWGSLRLNHLLCTCMYVILRACMHVRDLACMCVILRAFV